MSVLLLSRSDVEQLVDLDDCIAAVETAFAMHGRGETAGPASLSVHVTGGAFHIKAAALPLSRKYFAAKSNGNFFDNPARGLSRIHGVIVLADAENGVPLALLDSIYITIVRTGAATAVAAKHLSRPDSKTLLVCGCGHQGRVSIDAVRRVRPIERVLLYDIDRSKADNLAGALGRDLDVTVIDRLSDGSRDADICVTCTPSKTPFFTRQLAHDGMFIAAVGADSSEKLEMDPALMRSAAVVVDDVEQCASFGDLRGAVAAGMSKSEVRGSLADAVTSRLQFSNGEIVIFDSTGTALQDVAAAAIVYERALARGIGGQYRINE